MKERRRGWMGERGHTTCPTATARTQGARGSMQGTLVSAGAEGAPCGGRASVRRAGGRCSGSGGKRGPGGAGEEREVDRLEELWRWKSRPLAELCSSERGRPQRHPAGWLGSGAQDEEAGPGGRVGGGSLRSIWGLSHVQGIGKTRDWVLSQPPPVHAHPRLTVLLTAAM